MLFKEYVSNLGYIGMDEPSTVLQLAYANEATKASKNVLFYGKGGFGKTDLSKMWIDFLHLENPDITYKVIPFNKATPVEILIGAINLKKVEEGIISYNLQESPFMLYDIIIIEEAFDAPIKVFEALKEILMSGELKDNYLTLPIKTKQIICLTNRDPAEIIKNADTVEKDSFLATLMRIPNVCKVEWNNLNADAYKRLYKPQVAKKYCSALKLTENDFNSTLDLLAQISADIADKGGVINPRLFKHALDAVARNRAETPLILRHTVGFRDYPDSVDNGTKFIKIEAVSKTVIEELSKVNTAILPTANMLNINDIFSERKRLNAIKTKLEDYNNNAYMYNAQVVTKVKNLIGNLQTSFGLLNKAEEAYRENI